MKIFQFVSYSNDSHYFANLGKGLAEKGFDVSYGTLFETGREKPEWMKLISGADYFCLHANSKKDFPLAVLKLARILRSERIDILQAHLYEASFVGMLAAKLARIPLRILTRHHLDQVHIIGNKLPLMLDRWEAKTADKIVTLSNAVRDFLISREQIGGGKIEVIYQGFDFENFSADESDRRRIREEFGFTESDFVIGTIGNFFPTKGHRFLVSAMKESLADIPNLKLLFVGDGGDKETLKRQIAELGLTERVVFAGFRKDVNAFMKAVDAVLHPSLSEAFCQVLIETMSVGTPIISTDVGGAREVITDGENGLLIPAEDIQSIVGAIKNIYNNKDFAEKIAVAGQKSVRSRFTIEKMVNHQAECYENWLKEKKNGI
jgi:glycosyltransferase involved in cell wall biosynthesis